MLASLLPYSSHGRGQLPPSHHADDTASSAEGYHLKKSRFRGVPLGFSHIHDPYFRMQKYM
jgi:hypothetical protein